MKPIVKRPLFDGSVHSKQLAGSNIIVDPRMYAHLRPSCENCGGGDETCAWSCGVMSLLDMPCVPYSHRCIDRCYRCHVCPHHDARWSHEAS
jgi:hypothetical protein